MSRLDPIIERFRFSHHSVAMMFAAGLTIQEIVKRTGFTQRRLVLLLDDPTFCELIEHYRKPYQEKLREAIPSAMEDMDFVRAGTVRQMRDHIERADDEGELLPIPLLVKMHSEMADRTGYSKHTLKTVVSIDFATALERAIERSGKGEVIEGRAMPPGLPSAASLPAPASRPREYRRI
jgi:hypothetical protein